MRGLEKVDMKRGHSYKQTSQILVRIGPIRRFGEEKNEEKKSGTTGYKHTVSIFLIIVDVCSHDGIFFTTTLVRGKY